MSSTVTERSTMGTKSVDLVGRLVKTVYALERASDQARSYASDRLWCCQRPEEREWRQCARCLPRHIDNAYEHAREAAHHARTLAAVVMDGRINPAYLESRLTEVTR